MTCYVKHNYQYGRQASPNLQQFEFVFHNSKNLVNSHRKIWPIHLTFCFALPNLSRITYLQGNFFNMFIKRSNVISILLIVTSLSGIVACNKGTQTTSYVSQGTVTATLGSTSYAPTLTEAIYSPVTYSTFIVLGIQPGKDTNYLRIELPLTGFTIGTPFSSDTATASGVTWFDSQRTFEYDAVFGNGASHSLINVTSWDSVGRKVAGTFSAVLYNINSAGDSIVLTNGTFNTSYTEE
jgi:hypothetical protein